MLTEEEARGWIEDRFGSDHVPALEDLVTALEAESVRQNLVSRSSMTSVWSRHLVDSAQLLDHAPTGWRHWGDVGTGAGFPGLVIAILTNRPVTLIEPRRKRAEFLRSFCETRALASRVRVLQAMAARVIAEFDVISARAVAPIGELFAMTLRCASPDTVFLLLRGRAVRDEVATAKDDWHGVFHVKPSVTSADSGVVVANEVRSK